MTKRRVKHIKPKLEAGETFSLTRPTLGRAPGHLWYDRPIFEAGTLILLLERVFLEPSGIVAWRSKVFGIDSYVYFDEDDLKEML